MNLQTFIFIGRSGCGKGTQVALLQEYIQKQDHKRHIFYIETGERFRQFTKEHSLSSRLAAEIYKSGNRQPDFIAVWMWSHLLVERMTGEEHVIFDGTPRSLHEAQIIDTAITFYNRQRPHVIYLNISREASKARMIARRRILLEKQLAGASVFAAKPTLPIARQGELFHGSISHQNLLKAALRLILVNRSFSFTSCWRPLPSILLLAHLAPGPRASPSSSRRTAQPGKTRPEP
jgi:adenylate kinase family enzyme